MKKSLLIIVFSLFLTTAVFSQVSFSGPADGFVSSGVTVSTDDYADYTGPYKNEQRIIPDPNIDENSAGNYVQGNLIDGSNFTPGVDNPFMNAGDTVIVFKKFMGLLDPGGYIPPDPYIAIGPNHIVQVDNGRFRITDKNGGNSKTINSDQWYSSVYPTASAFDPKVIYDQYDHRWVMVWLHSEEPVGLYLVSVSDDDDPNGVWFNWAIPNTTNGNTPVGNWTDYQGVGYDEEAVYITGRQFDWEGFKQYEKIRAINKNDLYVSSNPGTVNWRDWWNISYPGGGSSPDGIRPMRKYSPSAEYYLIVARSEEAHFGLYKLSDPFGTPSLTGVRVPVTSYTSPINAVQPGGVMAIDGGGSRIRNEPFFRDSVLYVTHAVETAGNHSGVHFVAIDLQSNAALQDMVIGDADAWHNYPALAVSKNHDVVITYGRSSLTDYMGAYFTIIPASTGLPSHSILLQPGTATYVKTFSGTRNRWGDYMGAWVDPVYQNNIWVNTEFVLEQDTWGNVVAGILTAPDPNPTISLRDIYFDFNQHEVGTIGDTASTSIKNLGEQDLVISDISNSNSDFEIITNLSFPITLSTYDSINFDIRFVPSVHGEVTDDLVITSNDPVNGSAIISLRAWGFIISPAEPLLMYASTAQISSGKILTIDLSTAAGTEIGESGFIGLESIAMNPDNRELLAILNEISATKLVRINSDGGDAYLHLTIPLIFHDMAFDTDNTLYIVTDDKKLYTVDIVDGTTNFIADIGISVAALTVNPVDGSLWASVDELTEKDRLYTIDKTTGDTTRIGITGLNKITRGLAFDNNGDLYGVIGEALQRSFLISVDKNTAAGVIIGEVVDYKGITGLAFSPDTVTSAGNDVNSLPKDYTLSQNYPNPFNPATNITFALPVNSHVNLTVYDILGRQVDVLINGNMSAGYHSKSWNAGKSLSSGIYFYRITAQGVDGREFISTKKLMLLK